MEIRDVLHGAIQIEPHEVPVLDSIYFQRLRNIKQMGFAEYSFPSATHSRYAHSLGAMHIATLLFNSILSNCEELSAISKEDRTRLKVMVRLGAMLHDIGHGPLSHTTEIAMPMVSKLSLPFVSGNRQATHEDYTLKIIVDSELTSGIERLGKTFGFKPLHIASLISNEIELEESSPFICSAQNKKIDFRSLLHQIISSEFDADRMDYLRRDNLFSGVSYGEFDFDWILANITAHIHDGRCYLTLGHRSIYAFEDFLISRYHMFLMVYFHHKAVVFDEMLARYLREAKDEYALPADIESYRNFDDAHLLEKLAHSKNPWAKRIIDRRPYKMLIELHSGIPSRGAHQIKEERPLREVMAMLEQANIHYIATTSTSELSKYFKSKEDPIFVRYNNGFHEPKFFPLNDCTNVFERYTEKRSISRLYVAPENIEKSRQLFQIL